MLWEKKICIRLTTRRIVGAILVASTAVNVMIVGAAFGAAPSAATRTPTSSVTATTQFQEAVPTTSEGYTSTSIPTSTVSPTPTDTPTELPTLALCVLRSDWPIYYVQPGDTLSSVARATGSTADELMLANCLPNQNVYPGQLLYVPRLPVKPPTFTPSATQTDTPTVTSTHTPVTGTPPTNTPTITTTITYVTPPTNTPTPTLTGTQGIPWTVSPGTVAPVTLVAN